MPSAACNGDQLKAIELIHSTQIAQEAKDCMVWGAIEGNQSGEDARRFMALAAIEGNRTRPFNSGGAGSQALHGLGCD